MDSHDTGTDSSRSAKKLASTLSTNNGIDQFAQSLIGETKSEVKRLCTMGHVSWRITREDDARYMITDDYVPDRLNIEFVKSRAKKVTRG